MNAAGVPCPLCAAPSAVFGSALALGRHPAQYRRCGACGYVFVERPYWLAEAYADSAIAALDSGIAHRNLWLADAVAGLLALRYPRTGRCLDHGGGSGLFVRLLRDRGYDFRWRDRYCDNLFARGFEATEGDRYDVVTCFEVVEHLEDPLATFRELAALAPVLVLSTELLPEPAPALDAWPYYAPDCGQHIGFFSRAALEGVARTLGRRLASDGRMLHVIAADPPPDRLLRLLAKRRWSRLAQRLRRRRPLTFTDAAALAQALAARRQTRGP